MDEQIEQSSTTSDSETVQITIDPSMVNTPQTKLNPPPTTSSITCQTDGCNQLFTDLNIFQEHVKSKHGDIQRNEKGQFAEGNKESVGNDGGRPCEFCKRKEEILKATKEYLDPFLKTIESEKPREPLKEILALKIGVSDRTIERWIEKDTTDSDEDHSEFCHLISLLMTCAKAYNLRKLNGRYNARGAEFKLARMHGLIETSKTVHAGDINEPLQIIITEEEDKKKDGE